MKLRVFLLTAMICTLCVGQASALEYTMDAPEDHLFGRPTSDDTIYEWEDPNVDRSKNTALIQMLSEFGILEIAKTGTIAIERGRSTIYDNNKLQEEYDYGKNVL